MSKYVGVRHGEQKQVYWFEVPLSLQSIACIGASVTCDTRRGEMPGTIVKILEGLDKSEATRIVAQKYYPLSRLLTVQTEQKMSDIYIPFEMETGCTPQPEELADRVREFYATGGFSNVAFRPDGTLIDGYSAYMVAKMLGHDTLKGIVCPTAQEIAEA